MAEQVPDYGEPWRVDKRSGYVDRDGDYLVSAAQPGGLVGTRDRAVACVNALAGLPTTRLETPSRELTLFRAWLAGDDDAAALAADSLLDERQAEAVPGYVSREKLLGLLRRAAEHMVYAQSFYRKTHPVHELIEELQSLLGDAP